MEQAPLGTPRPTVNAGSDSNAPTTPYGRVPAMIIRMRLRAGAHASAVRTDRRERGLNEESTTRPQERTRLPPAAPTAKSPAQGRTPVESHLRSPTEPHK